MALVSFFRNPVLAKVVGVLAALAFLLPLVRYRGAFGFMIWVASGIILFALLRSYVLKRRKRLTPPEERYLQDRFYEQ